jgi:hypothetical protein
MLLIYYSFLSSDVPILVKEAYRQSRIEIPFLVLPNKKGPADTGPQCTDLTGLKII